jgi:hypothetical protein
LNAFLRIYRGGAVAIDGRGIVTPDGGGSAIRGEPVDKSEISTIGIVESMVVGREVFEETSERSPSSSSAMSLSEDSGSAAGEVSLFRARPRLSFFSSVNVRRRAFRIGATGVVIASGLCIETSSSESLESGATFVEPRLGYKNYPSAYNLLDSYLGTLLTRKFIISV